MHVHERTWQLQVLISADAASMVLGVLHLCLLCCLSKSLQGSDAMQERLYLCVAKSDGSFKCEVTSMLQVQVHSTVLFGCVL
jgi:hypothetical protein